MMQKKQLMIVSIIIVLTILSLTLKTGQVPKEETEVKTISGGWDISEQVKEKGYEQYLVETSDFDYSNPIIFNLAQEIKSSTSTPEQAVKQTLQFVVQNVKYSSAITTSYCYKETASKVAEIGEGDCVSMARLVTSLLRAQGIPARTAGGCLSMTKRCAPIFSVVPDMPAQVTPMTEGDFKKRGFLHEWVEFFIPENNGWQIAESTSGQVFDSSCVAYKMYSYDTEADRCTINSREFWDVCKDY